MGPTDKGMCVLIVNQHKIMLRVMRFLGLGHDIGHPDEDGTAVELPTVLCKSEYRVSVVGEF